MNYVIVAGVSAGSGAFYVISVPQKMNNILSVIVLYMMISVLIFSTMLKNVCQGFY